MDINKKIERLETPAYLYDIDLLKKTLDALSLANSGQYKLHYALKANTDQRVLETILSYGHGADCVSGGEITKALASGFAPQKITFAGVGKSDGEIILALKAGIGYFNVESLEEIEVIAGLARDAETSTNVCLRINPNIDAHTHAHITTGLEDAKFGIALIDIEEALGLISASEYLSFKGIHFHIGSQIYEMQIFEELARAAMGIVEKIEASGQQVTIINLGGGLAVDYQNPVKNNIADFENYFKAIANGLSLRDDQEVHFELGRSIVAQCGQLVTKVLFNKKAANRNVVIVDAGMTELMRPALYDAYHYIENISSDLEKLTYTVVGPICESTDTFGEDRSLNLTKRGDTLLIHSTGAYGQTMSSEYNHRPKAKVYYRDKI